MGDYLDLKELLAAILFSAAGMVIFFVVSWIYDRLTPFDVWKEIAEKQNVAVAIVIAAMMIGISIIIASAHG
jgi:putative membrane protein